MRMDLTGAQTQFHLINQFSFFTDSEIRDNICSLLKTMRSYNIFIDQQILIYIQDILQFWWFHLLHHFHQTNFSVGAVKRCDSTFNFEPFWGIKDKSLATMTLICKRYSILHHRSLSQLCSRSLQMHLFPFAAW